MKIKPLKLYKPLFTGGTRYYLVYGGRAAGRSYNAAMNVVFDTLTQDYSRIAVMRQILSDVRSSIWQEVKDRIDEWGLPPVTADQAMKYYYRGNTVDGKGFKKSSGQNKSKLKSLASYNCVVIEEADEIDEEDFDELDTSIRTPSAPNKIILLFNMPHKDHWIMRRFFNLQESDTEGYYEAIPKNFDDVTYIFGTYKDNRKNLSESAIKKFEQYQETNPDYYHTMIRGLVSEGQRGRIFKNWKPMTDEEFDNLPYASFYGLDFGFSNDPTALVEVKEHNRTLYVRELVYETGLLNSDLSRKMNNMDVEGQVISDVEPKSIEEMNRYGHQLQKADKSKDSVVAGISKLHEYEVYYTENSDNIKKEIQNYVWDTDQHKNPVNYPVDAYNHAMDAIRYAVYTDRYDFSVFEEM